MTERGNGGPMVKLCGMFENTAKASGQTYFVGYVGGAKFILLKDKNAAEGQAGWALFVAERPAKPAGSGSDGSERR